MYRIKGQPIQGKARSREMTKNMEQVAPKVEQFRGSQPLGSSGEKHLASSFKYIKKAWDDLAGCLTARGF